MNTIGERLSALIKELGLTKTKFAEAIHVGQPFISNICSGIKEPSDRTISDICREFRVSEAWLRYGEGEMLIKGNRNEEIQATISEILADEDDAFRKRLIAALCALDVDEWKVLEKISQKVLENTKNPDEH